MTRRIALVGSPNVGKSTLFNALTGLRQHTGNWAGKTVELARGTYFYRGDTYELTDFPGMYALSGGSQEERVASKALEEGCFDAIVVVCDAGCLERQLILLLQILKRQTKVILCCNLMDEARRMGITVDEKVLSRRLGIPVLATAAGQGEGLEPLRKTVCRMADGLMPCRPLEVRGNGAAQAEEITAQAVRRAGSAHQKRTQKIDRLLTGPVTGYLTLAAVLLVVLWLTMVGANYPGIVLEWLFGWGERGLSALLGAAPWWLRGILVDGVYAVTAKVLTVMVPPLLIFFPLFTFLEDVGYLPRAAYLMDGWLSRWGTSGKAALTMAMGMGCNAIGVTGCRIMDCPKQRQAARITNGFIPCNGRFPTLTFLAAGFFGGGLPGAALVLAMLALGILGAVVSTGLLRKTVLKGEDCPFLLELPPLRWPRLGQILVRSVLDRTVKIALRALKVAAPAGAVLWLLLHLADGAAGDFLVGLLEPVGQVLGLNGVILLAFFLALPANELLLPVIFLLLGGESTAPNLMAAGWTQWTALSVMFLTVFHWPCATTLMTIRKEAGDMKSVLLAALLPTLLGVLGCLFLTALRG